MFLLLSVCIIYKNEKLLLKKTPEDSNCSDLKITDFQGVSKEKICHCMNECRPWEK